MDGAAPSPRSRAPRVATRRGTGRPSSSNHAGSKLRTKQCGRMLHELLGPRARFPLLEADSARMREIVLEDLHLPLRERRVVDVEARLVVQAERTIVEI